MNARLETVPSRRVAYLRALGRYPETFPKLWPRFRDVVMPLGLFGKGAALSVMHDNPNATPPERIRGDAAIEVGPEFVPSGELAVQDLPGGQYAVCEVRGPYTGLAAAWGQFVGQWVPEQGLRPAGGPSYEVYANDPSRVPPEEILTVLYLPVVADA